MNRLYQILAFHPIEAVVRVSPNLARQVSGQAVSVGVLLFTAAVLNMVDLMYTLFAHRVGMLKEMNPLAEAYLSQDLTLSLVAYKILMVFAGSFMLWRLRESRWAVPACWVIVAMYGGLSVMWYLWARDVHFIYETMLVLNNRSRF